MFFRKLYIVFGYSPRLSKYNFVHPYKDHLSVIFHCKLFVLRDPGSKTNNCFTAVHLLRFYLNALGLFFPVPVWSYSIVDSMRFTSRKTTKYADSQKNNCNISNGVQLIGQVVLAIDRRSTSRRYRFSAGRIRTTKEPQ